MHWMPRRWTLVGVLLAMMVTISPIAMAQVATTQVADTVYRADGSTATGTVVISWPAFTTAAGQSVPAGSTSAAITAGGVLSVQLAPNAGSNPMGSYYTVVYHLDDGSVSHQYWVVPSSGTPVNVSAISSTVVPLAVAQQTVSKAYVDTAIAQAVTGVTPADSSTYVLKAGDTMTGPLVLPGDPTATTQAADKHYVDTSVQQVAAGVGQKVSLLPQANQVVAQPTGTALTVNKLNGVEYATQYVTNGGNNAITNATASPDCASGCEVKVGNDYNSTEQPKPSSWNSQTHVEDTRQGARVDTYSNPGSTAQAGGSIGQTVTLVATQPSGIVGQTIVSEDPNVVALDVSTQALSGGSNLFPQSIETVPYFKSNYSVERMVGNYYTQGQHDLMDQTINCFGVGDCIIGSQQITASGGFRDEADEGAHPSGAHYEEDSRVFAGTCSSGCSTGSTAVTVAVTSAGGTQGEGRYLIDKNPAKILNTGSLVVGYSHAPHPSATFSGTSFPVSIFFATAQKAPSQANLMAPGTVTLAIQTSGVPAGFSTNTAAAPSPSGVACLADYESPGGSTPHNYEMANYIVVDGTHIQFTLNKVHASNTTVAIGGLCGYGIEQTVDTQNGIRQVFPVIGSDSPTDLYYGGGQTAVLGAMGQTSGFLNISATVATIARTGNVVTLTATGSFSTDINGLTMQVSGVTDSSYNGSFVVTTTGSSTLTYTQTGPDSTSTGGTVSILTGGYVLYPMAEVLSVMNPATKLVDGQMTLAPNTVAWSAGDVLEEPHYYQERVFGYTSSVSQTTPRPGTVVNSGIEYDGTNSVGLQGWRINNATSYASYLGAGGTHAVPDSAFVSQGVWKNTMTLDAGQQSVFTVNCNYKGCNRWNSSYLLFQLQSSVGYDTMIYNPQASGLSIGLRGASYSFSPQAFTAGTINAGTISASTINGSMNANSITSGAVAAAYLPMLGASGSAHAAGIVPDPGATSGTTRFLREDGTWSVPAGGAVVAGGNTILPGATADYNFLQGSGTTLTDSSGNGNNGTLMSGASAPVWTATGLNFSNAGGTPQGVSLPAALNNTKTILVVATSDPIGNSASPAMYKYSTLVTSSLGASGLNFLNEATQASGNFLPSTFGPSIFASGVSKTFVPDTLSGLHCEAMTVGTGGTDKDHLYIDGNEVASYFAQGASYGAQSSGNLYLGSTNAGVWTSGGFVGTFYRTRFYPTELTASQVNSTCAGMEAEVASRGVSLTPLPIRAATPQIHAIGDSITSGTGTTTPYLTLLSLTNQPTYTTTNWGIPNMELVAMAGSEANRVALRCTSSAGPVIASIFAGTNDFYYLDPGAATVMTSLASEILTLKSAGCKVFVLTMLSRNGSTQSGVHTMDSQKDAYDALILQQAKLLGADGVIDVAANPLLGADGAYANTTYFNTDQTHPTNAGQSLLASAYSNTLNYFFGSKAANPTVVTANTYQMLSGDGAVTAAPTASAAYTLPDCVGPSGESYTISNPQSAFPLTITGKTGQPINGLTTAITVPNNSTVTLRDVPNPKTVSGCHWVM